MPSSGDAAGAFVSSPPFRSRGGCLLPASSSSRSEPPPSTTARRWAPATRKWADKPADMHEDGRNKRPVELPRRVLEVPSEEPLLLPIQERVRKTNESLEADFSKISTKIHRFPQGLRWIGGQGGRYITPSFVAIGPYHHDLPQLQEMEGVKHAAAHYLCTLSGHSIKDVYDKILSISGEARGCYANDDAVTRFSDAEFTTMMFLDGCFLLNYIAFDSSALECALLANWMTLSAGPCMLRDIFLLENQLPWLVLETLLTFASVDVYSFVSNRASSFEARPIVGTRLSRDEFQRYRPPHLLALLRYYQIVSMPAEDLSYKGIQNALTISVIELAEIGIKLTASNNSWFADMIIQKGPLFGELSLTPLFLNDVTTCWLVNMAAFEACTSTNWPLDGYTICSYLSLLAMLMDKEEDVHELRTKHLVRSFFSNQELLPLFKGLACHLRLGYRYYITLDKIYEYKLQRPVRIAVHKFLYNNFKTIATLLSIAGVLVGIFKTLLSLRQH